MYPYIALLIICALFYLPATASDSVPVHKECPAPIMVEASQAALILVPGHNFEIIDGRSAQMFATGHIAGAINIDAYIATADSLVSLLDENKQYLLYCTSNKRSAVLEVIMSKYRLNLQYIISDGLDGWKAMGLPVGYPVSAH
jgi:rhodanese-related sulfurtransferase